MASFFLRFSLPLYISIIVFNIVLSARWLSMSGVPVTIYRAFPLCFSGSLPENDWQLKARLSSFLVFQVVRGP